MEGRIGRDQLGGEFLTGRVDEFGEPLHDALV
jgi:hypothetical protein